MFILAPSNILTTAHSNIKYIISQMNSKVFNWYFSKLIGITLGEAFEWKKQYVENIPIPKISQKEQKPFEILVDYILYIKEQKLESSLSEYLEVVIDKMVLDLYFEELSKKHQVYALEALSEIILQFEKKAINEKNTIDLVNHLKECKEYKEHQNKFLDIPEFSLISKS